MIVRLFQFTLTFGVLGLLTLGLLVVIKSPDWSYWPLALLAGEFGHWLALIALGLAGAAWLNRGTQPVFHGGVAIVGIVAAGLLFRPVIQARLIARTLPAKLERQLGHAAVTRPAFSWRALFSRRPETVGAETLVYSAGLSLDFYRAVGRVHAPCVLLIHGGGWDSGEKGEFPNFNYWLAREGYNVAAISYRLAPMFPWPAARDDVSAALAFLKAHAAELGLDATRFVLLGRSAGGHLAEAMAYSAHDPAIRGVVALYAPADVHFAWEFARDDDVLKSPALLKRFLGGTPETARGAYDAASPILHVDQTTPPTLLIHGQLDTLVWHRQSERLDKKLTEAGVKHAFISLPWATHAFEYNLGGPGGQLTTYGVEWFLAAVTK